MGNGVITAPGTTEPAPPAVRARLADFLGRIGFPLAALLLLVVFPLLLSEFRLSLLAKYLCFAFPAVGIELIWGYGGI